MLLRNREVRRALIACIICTLAGCVAAYLITLGLLERTATGAYLVSTAAGAVAPADSASTALTLSCTLAGCVAAYLITLGLLERTATGAYLVSTAAGAVAPADSASTALTLSATARTVALAASCCAGLTGAVVTAIFMALTARRYRALGRMADNLDRVLAGERDISLRDMEEGELAILSSEVDKVIARLNLTVDELQAEKLALSDSLADISHQLKTPLTSIAISTELVRDRVIARLNLTVDELQAEKLALSDSLADISHQLKTPLTSIAISTELVRDRLADRGDSRDLVERLRLVQRLQGRCGWCSASRGAWRTSWPPCSSSRASTPA